MALQSSSRFVAGRYRIDGTIPGAQSSWPSSYMKAYDTFGDECVTLQEIMQPMPIKVEKQPQQPIADESDDLLRIMSVVSIHCPKTSRASSVDSSGLTFDAPHQLLLATSRVTALPHSLKQSIANAALVNHECISIIMDIKVTETALYIVLPRCEQLMSQIVAKREYAGKPIDYEFASAVSKSLLRAVEHIHRAELCHANIALENLNVDDQHSIRLAGFERCMLLSDCTPQSSTCPAKDIYIAPEARGEFYDGKKSDMWSVGVCLAQLYGLVADVTTPKILERIASGEGALPDEMPAAAQLLLRRLLSGDPLQRPTASEVLSVAPWNSRSSQKVSVKRAKRETTPSVTTRVANFIRRISPNKYMNS